MYFFKTFGILIEPSSFWLFSSKAIISLPTAKPDPLSVPTNSFPLSDLYLDTETLDNVQKALPEIDLDEVYGNEAGGVAKFTSILTQYGTGFALAQKIAKKVIGKAVSTKLAQKTAKNLAKTKAGEAGVNLAKFGGYWVLPGFAADTAVSATGQRSVGDVFGDEEGNFLKHTDAV